MASLMDIGGGVKMLDVGPYAEQQSNQTKTLLSLMSQMRQIEQNEEASKLRQAQLVKTTFDNVQKKALIGDFSGATNDLQDIHPGWSLAKTGDKELDKNNIIKATHEDGQEEYWDARGGKRIELDMAEQKRIDALNKAGETSDKKAEADADKAAKADDAKYKIHQANVERALALTRSGTKTFQQAQFMWTKSKDALRIIDMVEQGKVKLTPQVALELAGAAQSVITGSTQPAESLIKGMVPDTVKARASAAMQFLKSTPVDSMTPEMVGQFKHQLVALKDFWQDEVTANLRGVAAGVAPWYNRKDNAKYRESFVNTIQQRYAPNMKVEEIDDIFKSLAGEKTTKALTPKAETGTVRMVNANGDEFEIPSAMRTKAEQDGLKLIGQ